MSSVMNGYTTHEVVGHGNFGLNIGLRADLGDLSTGSTP